MVHSPFLLYGEVLQNNNNTQLQVFCIFQFKFLAEDDFLKIKFN